MYLVLLVALLETQFPKYYTVQFVFRTIMFLDFTVHSFSKMWMVSLKETLKEMTCRTATNDYLNNHDVL